MNLMLPRRRWATALSAMLCTVLLAGCSHLDVSQRDARALLRDDWFGPSQEDTDPAKVLALSDAMRQYADQELRSRVPSYSDPRRVLVEALHRRGQLRLAYDAAHTGNAAETFEARSGNCMSLVLMTAAFARHLDLPVAFRSVQVDPQYTRAGGLTLESGHVNLVMLPIGERPLFGVRELIIDFLPSRELAGYVAVDLDERAVVAMYMNNRAAEALAAGRTDASYAWARAALMYDPSHASAVNTLAVIYMRRGEYGAAENALRFALQHDRDNTAALSNLVLALRSTGRAAEAQVVQARLKVLQPHPPFYFLEAGVAALQAGQAAEARDLFERELRRQPFQHEVHFWSAQAWAQLGNGQKAVEHLRHAMDYSTTIASQKLYAGKLDRLRALRLQ
jgi:Tfp pilus assembly protein PilF